MARLTTVDEQGNIFVNEEERLLSSKGFIDKDEMYKIMMHLAEKLADYENLEEQGILLSTKIIPGQYVWEVNVERNIISEYEVCHIKYGVGKRFFYAWALRDGIYSNLKGFYDKDIGVTVFLTKEEAQQALETLNVKPKCENIENFKI